MDASFLDEGLKKIKRAMFGAKEQQAFLEDVVTMIEDGVPANKAVEALGKIAKGTSAEVAQDILDKISEGKPIADGLMNWFPEHIVELIRAGEGGGSLAQTMRSASDALERKSSATGSLVTSLTYPLVVIGMAFVIMIYMNNSVFKQFKTIRPVEDWPAIGQNIVMVADFVNDWWWIIIILLVAAFIGIARMLRNYVGEYRKYIDLIPLLSLYKDVSAAQFMETLGLLVDNGVVFKEALKLMQYQASPYLAYHLLIMDQKLGLGKGNIAEVIDTGMIDRDAIVRLQVTASAKDFTHALIRLGQFASRRVQATISRTGKILGGLFLAVGAGLAVFMVLAIYSVGSSLAN